MTPTKLAAPTANSDSETQASTAVISAIIDGLETRMMRVECGLTRGFAGLQMIGNTAEVCRDGKERARAALERLNIHLPPQRLVLSLTPADVRKDGNQFDLPIAVSLALLIKGGQPRIDPTRWLMAAELGISGELRPVKGIVSFAVTAIAEGMDGIVVAMDNLREVIALQRLGMERSRPFQIFAFRELSEVLDWLIAGQDPGLAEALVHGESVNDTTSELPNFDDMVLHPTVELAAVVAAAGLHSILMRGSPGTGKSMLAARLPSILPALATAEHIDVMRIHSSFAEKLPAAILRGRPPYRSPHHQASAAAILGSAEAPGEISLAHGGILFLDELPEFRRDLIESLREPLETGVVQISRSRRKATWSARALLVAACNNCPCGWFASKRNHCKCGYNKRQAYLARLSGPILDRIDIQLNMPEPEAETSGLFLQLATTSGPSQTQVLAARVIQARQFAQARNALLGVVYNRDLAAQHMLKASGLSEAAFAKMVNAVIPRSASSRAALRALRVARTLADLAGSEAIRVHDIETAWAWQAEPAARQRGEFV